MKNIHVLPTDKPSRLYSYKNNLFLTTEIHLHSPSMEYQHIYITSEEEIKDCWVLNTHTNQVYFLKGFYGIQPVTKKIILTTDQDLIKNGVQAIDDEFLKWFVNNPSCEEVEVEIWTDYRIENNKEVPFKNYKLITPQVEPKQFVECKCTNSLQAENCIRNCGHGEEPKQETFEEPTMIDDWLNEYGDPEIYKKVERELELREAAEKYSLELLEAKTIQHHEKTWIKSMFIHIAKWQAERMYSEEDMTKYALYILHNNVITPKEWFEQFKT